MHQLTKTIVAICFCFLMPSLASAQTTLRNGTLTIRHIAKDGNHLTQLRGDQFSNGVAVTYALLIDGDQVDTFNVSDVRKIVVIGKASGLSSVLINGYGSPQVQIKAAGGGLLALVGGELGNVAISGTPKSDVVFLIPPEGGGITQVAGSFKVTTKGGDDTVGMNGSFLFGSVSINTGGGDDVFFMETLFVPANVNVKTGGGDDTALIGAEDRDDLAVVFLGQVNFTMGGGNDELTIGSDITYTASLVRLNGSGGYDELDSFTVDNGIDIRGFDNFPF